MESPSAPPITAESIRSVSIESGPHKLSARLHRPDGPARSTAVLICSPWGPDEHTSYRPRRAWGLRLAGAGYPTLRFDLPATGDSTGVPADEGLVAAWSEAIDSAATWLRENLAVERVVALGLGVGGSLAIEAIANGAPIDDLVLWASPNNGRGFVREMRNFSLLEDWNQGDAVDPAGELPSGWLEVDGFALSASTIAELEALKVDDGSRGPKRALLMGRNTGQEPKGLGDRLEAGGCLLTYGAGGQWGAFVCHPAESRLPPEIAEAVESWLGDLGAPDAPTSVGDGPGVRSAETAGAEEPTIRVEVGQATVLERPFSLPMPFGEIFGVLAEPSAGSKGDLCAVYLNSGAQRHSGPNRMWTESARRWAARGIPTLRLDLQQIGESGGDPQGMPLDDVYFSPKFSAQVKVVLDALEQRGLGPRFLLLGLCSGAYHAYRVTVMDERVAGVALVNPTVFVWRDGILQARELRTNVSFVGEGQRMRKFLRGEIGPRRIAEWLVSLGRGGVRAIGRMAAQRGRQKPDWKAQVVDEFGALARRGVPVLVAFSGGEGLNEELDKAELWPRLTALPNVELAALPGNDHILRPIAAQRRFAELLDDHLSSVLVAMRASQANSRVEMIQRDG